MKRRALVATLVTLALAGVAFEIYRAGEHELPAPNSNSQIVFHGGSASGRRIETKSWSANYDRIVSNADQTMLDVDGVRDGIIDRKGHPFLRVKAQHVTVNTISRDMEITGPLHIETIDTLPARTFDTNGASWNDAMQTLTLSKPVTVRTTARPPFKFASATLDMKTGEIVVHDPSGPFR